MQISSVWEEIQLTPLFISLVELVSFFYLYIYFNIA